MLAKDGEISEDYSIESLVFLTRESAGDNRPRRWLDIEECYKAAQQEFRGVSVTVLDPAISGPRQFLSEYGRDRGTIFIAAPGSAIYNIMFLSLCSVIVPVESLPAGCIWSGQINDLRAYSQRIVFIAKQLSDCNEVKWDQSFSLGGLPDFSFFKLTFNYLLSCKSRISDDRFIINYGKFYISFPLPL